MNFVRGSIATAIPPKTVQLFQSLPSDSAVNPGLSVLHSRAFQVRGARVPGTQGYRINTVAMRLCSGVGNVRFHFCFVLIRGSRFI